MYGDKNKFRTYLDPALRKLSNHGSEARSQIGQNVSWFGGGQLQARMFGN